MIESMNSSVVMRSRGLCMASPLARDAHDLGTPAIGGAVDHRADLVRSLPQRIIRKMSVTRGRSRIGVPKQRADDRQAQPAAGADAGERVAQVVEPIAWGEPGALADEFPHPFDVLHRLTPALAREDPCLARFALLAQPLDEFDGAR